LPAVILGSPLRIFWVQYVLSGPLRQSLFKPQALLNYDIFKDKIYLYLTLFFVALIIIVALKLKSKR
jgi:hypothetical protein